MRAPYTELYLHSVWATWDRLPLITPEVEAELYSAIRAKCDELKCPCLAIGGMPDHVHVLMRLHATVAVADLLKVIKGASSHLITHMVQPGGSFKWQGAYGAFTVSKSDVPRCMAYVERQKQHHAGHELWDEWEQTLIEKDGGALGG
jgi:REP element-mobilizing transposase RayT